MEIQLTKYFHFSASHSRKDKVWGHNYVLGVTVDALDPEAEETLVASVERVVSPLHSRDLGADVDFLKGIEITDRRLLEAFWPRVAEAASPARLRALSLERDRRTVTTMGEGRL